MRRWALALALVVSGCVVEHTHTYERVAPAPRIVAGDPMETAWIITDATLELLPGVGVGYAVTYASGGIWRVRFACDSYASGLACAFDGVITATDGDEFSDLRPMHLESTDSVWYADEGHRTLGFSTVATTTLDGFDFVAPPGARVTFDLLVDGYRYAQFVFFASGDPANSGEIYTASPLREPFTLLPTVP